MTDGLPLDPREQAPRGEDAFNLAAARVVCHLTYGRTSEPRKFWQDCVDNDEVPDAFGKPGSTSGGEWYQTCHVEPSEATEQEWIDHMASMVVNEAIHEALEWVQVDGRPWLNPHGEQEKRIFDLTNALCAELAKLAAADREVCGG